MIDTIILQLKQGQFTIMNYSKFKTSKETTSNAKDSFCKWSNNPTALDKKLGIYKPRATLIKRGYLEFLKIEFSAPKLIFKNNLEELTENDFSLVVDTLKKRLEEMDILVFKANLENAEVISFHPSKNIKLNNGYTSNFAIRQLSKVDMGKRFDIDVKDYRNNGESLQFYTRLFAICIYDKVNDYLKPRRRAIDKDQNYKQRSLFDLLNKQEPFFEVLRIEVRLNGKRKINELLQDLGFDKNPCFKDIFNGDLCKKILNYSWEMIFNKNEFIFSLNDGPQKILESLIVKNNDIKLIEAINIVGLYLLAKDKDGIGGLRKIIDARYKKHSWGVVRRYMSTLEKKIDHPIYGFVQDIERGLKEFKNYKL
ncbi:hypothetical protein M0Q39_06810 [Patescibacteria group bacterium]|nr:hypothetical protein [Patescibacteria group bacterium]